MNANTAYQILKPLNLSNNEVKALINMLNNDVSNDTSNDALTQNTTIQQQRAVIKAAILKSKHKQ